MFGIGCLFFSRLGVIGRSMFDVHLSTTVDGTLPRRHTAHLYLPVGLVANAMSHHFESICNHNKRIGINTAYHLLEPGKLPEVNDRVQDLHLPARVSLTTSGDCHPPSDFLYNLMGNFLPLRRNDVNRFSLAQPRHYQVDYVLKCRKRSVRPGKVAYSSGCESRSSKAGQPLDRGPWAGGSNSKG